MTSKTMRNTAWLPLNDLIALLHTAELVEETMAVVRPKLEKVTGDELVSVLIKPAFMTTLLKLRRSTLRRPRTASRDIGGLDFEITGNPIVLGAFAALLAAKVHRNFLVIVDGWQAMYAFDASQQLFSEANKTTLD